MLFISKYGKTRYFTFGSMHNYIVTLEYGSGKAESYYLKSIYMFSEQQ